jgi:tetratricopeptide (TPR) repeat protein
LGGTGGRRRNSLVVPEAAPAPSDSGEAALAEPDRPAGSVRLPPFTTVLLPALVLPSPSRDLAALAAGFVRDIALLMNRLGDVRVRSLVGDPDQPERPSTPRTAPWPDDALQRMLRARNGDVVIVGQLRPIRDGFEVAVSVRGADLRDRWADRVEIVEGFVQDARLVLAANLVEAATGRRKDVRRARLGGTQSAEAYRRLCLARFPLLDPGKRQKLLEEAIALDPSYAEALLLLADTLEAAGRRRDARQILKDVAKRFPRFSWARQRYGVALRVAAQSEQAVEEVQAALDADPDALTLFHAGLFAEAGQDPQTAATLYQRAVERGCIDPILCEKLGNLRANDGQYDDAIALWERALLLEPGFDHLIASLALARHHLGDEPAAEALFEEALEKAPRALATHANRGVWLQELERHEDAVAAWDTAIEIRPDSALLHNNRGISRLAAGDRTGARADFEAALLMAPDADLATYIRANLARIERGTDRLQEAGKLLASGADFVRAEQPKRGVPLLLEGLDLYPESVEGWLMLALGYRELRDWDAAADALAEALRRQPQNPDALGERALILLALGRVPEAIEHARAAVDARPDDAGLVCNLGLVLLEAGRDDEARERCARAAELDPTDPIVKRCQREIRRRARKDASWGDSFTDISATDG